MSWAVRMGMLALVLGLTLRLVPCIAENFVLDIGPGLEVYEFEFDVRDGCASEPFWFIPAFEGTCMPNTQNCTAAGGALLYASAKRSCPKGQVCCYIIQNSTMPTAGTLPTLPTIPDNPLPSCETPTAPSFNASNPDINGAFQNPNCTTASIPTMPTLPPPSG